LPCPDLFYLCWIHRSAYTTGPHTGFFPQ
jgi:hypothetical protein